MPYNKHWDTWSVINEWSEERDMEIILFQLFWRKFDDTEKRKSDHISVLTFGLRL